MTKQRTLILEIIREKPVHLTADEIFWQAKSRMPTISLATVYNNLNYLASHGMIRKLSVIGSVDRYDRTVGSHAHLICIKCKSISDVFLDDNSWIKNFTNELVTSYDLVLHYTCDKCKNKKL